MEGLLSLRGVWLSFPRGRRHTIGVLSDVSLDVLAGEVVAVLAQRAQGKTSLLRVAGGMERPDRGRILFGGEDIWARPARGGRRVQRRRRRPWCEQIVLVDQGAPDVDVLAVESVALPLGAAYGAHEARERAERALWDVGALECAESRWEDLNDRERARLALARAIAREPRLLLIDDLTATLELATMGEIAELVHTLARTREIAVLMSVGDARATRWSERVGTLAGGELLMPPPTMSEPPHEGRANVVDIAR
jgi:ABC-type cobalamin/Fe3+-siderophores transport system ATPase subunit